MESRSCDALTRNDIVSALTSVKLPAHPALRIMRPNTPHAVYTVMHSLCHGGHFYSMSTIQDTLFGIIHAFTSHENTRTMIRRMVIFVHRALIDQELDEDGELYFLSLKIPLKKSYLDRSGSWPCSGPQGDLLPYGCFGFVIPGRHVQCTRFPNIQVLSDDGTLMDAYDLNAMNCPEQMVCMYVRAMGWNIQDRKSVV